MAPYQHTTDEQFEKELDAEDREFAVPEATQAPAPAAAPRHQTQPQKHVG